MSYFDGRSWLQDPSWPEVPAAVIEYEDYALHIPASIAMYLQNNYEYFESTTALMLITQTGDQTDAVNYHPYLMRYFISPSDISPDADEIWFFDVGHSVYELRELSGHLNISGILSNYARAIAPGRYTQIDPTTAVFLRHIARQAGIDFSASLFADFYDPDACRYELAEQVAAFVSSAARYSLEPPLTPAYEDFVLYFLEHSQLGYCIHFATTATLMLRALGVPARFVTGFVADIPLNMVGEVVTVTDRYAHAWVEVFLDDFGWIPIEPTPATAGSIVPAAGGQNADETLAPDLANIRDDIFVVEDEFFLPFTPDETPYAAANEVSGISVFVLLIVLSVCVVIIIAVRIVTFKLRYRSFTRTDTNMAVINVWKYLNRLSRRKKVSFEIELLALKARFSQHHLAEHERQKMIRYAQTYRDEIIMTETFPVKLWLQVRML